MCGEDTPLDYSVYSGTPDRRHALTHPAARCPSHGHDSWRFIWQLPYPSESSEPTHERPGASAIGIDMDGSAPSTRAPGTRWNGLVTIPSNKYLG